MRWLLVILLLLPPAQAQDTETLMGSLTDMGAYVLVAKTIEGNYPALSRQTLKGQVALPPEQRWMLPAEALPLLLAVRINLGAETLRELDRLATEAHALGLSEQELALRVLAVQAADHGELPAEVHQRLPAILQLEVATPRGRILAFQAASYAFFYNEMATTPHMTGDKWVEGYNRASALLPREVPLDAGVLNRSFGLWKGCGDCLFAWSLRGSASQAGPAFGQAINRDVKWLVDQAEAGLHLKVAAFEPIMASLWLTMKSSDRQTLEKNWELVRSLDRQLEPLEESLARQEGKPSCRDQIAGLEALYHLSRFKALAAGPAPDGRALAAEMQPAMECVTRYGEPHASVELGLVISDLDLRSNQLERAYSTLQLLLGLPGLTRLQRANLLTQSARVRLAQGKPGEAAGLVLEARALQLAYLAEMKGSPELDQLYFRETLELINP